MFFFFFKQKTASEMRISDWSSDVCSSDLQFHRTVEFHYFGLDPQLLEVAASQVWILAGDTQVRGKRPPHVADRFSNRKAAMPDVEVYGSVEIRISDFLDHVRTDDADLCRALGHESREVKGAPAAQEMGRAAWRERGGKDV